tara:strand:- start:538 stop:2937 length:2400 start_codon:yes stop_codon:yes gene_type:complete
MEAIDRIVTYLDGFADKSPHHVSVDAILRGIKEGKHRNKINHMRTASDEVYGQLKKKLPLVIFTGIFSERKTDCFINGGHSGLVCLDFDKLSSDELKKAVRFFREDKYTYASFLSPSGKGLKVLVQIPREDGGKHRLRYDSLGEYYKGKVDGFDTKTSDFARGCFMSFDPNLYVNTESEVYLGIKEESVIHKPKAEVYLPMTNEGDVFSRLRSHQENVNPISNGRNNHLFSLACECNRHNVPKSTMESYANGFIAKDFTSDEIAITVNSAYDRDDAGTRVGMLNNRDLIQSVESDIKQSTDKNITIGSIQSAGYSYDVATAAYSHYEEESKSDIFWELGETKGGKVTVTPMDDMFCNVLNNHGFMRAEFGDAVDFIHIEGKIASPTTPSRIKDYIFENIINKATPRGPIFNKIARDNNFFSDIHLGMLSITEVNMNSDTSDTSYVYFQNGVVVLKKNQTRQFIPLSEVEDCVWESSLIKHDYVHEEESGESDFKTFIHNVCDDDSNRIAGTESAIGYLLHDFKEASNTKAIVLYDEVVAEGANGGTGKSIFAKAINEMRGSVLIDGKSVKSSSNFMYQRVSHDTKVINFDDVAKGFDFEKLFSVITEGVTVERKNAKEFHIPFEDAPKIVISSNYALVGSGDSFDRRTHTIEFAPFYNPRKKPDYLTGRNLFKSGWKGDAYEQYNKFHNYMLDCLQLYLDNGLIQPDLISKAKRDFHATCPEDIIDFFDIDSEDRFSDFGPMQFEELCGYMEGQNYRVSDYTDRDLIRWVRNYGYYRYGRNIVIKGEQGAKPTFDFPND